MSVCSRWTFGRRRSSESVWINFTSEHCNLTPLFCWSSVRLLIDHKFTDLRSVLWWFHSRTFTLLSVCVNFTTCFRLLSGWEIEPVNPVSCRLDQISLQDFYIFCCISLLLLPPPPCFVMGMCVCGDVSLSHRSQRSLCLTLESGQIYTCAVFLPFLNDRLEVSFCLHCILGAGVMTNQWLDLPHPCLFLLQSHETHSLLSGKLYFSIFFLKFL